MRSTRNQPFCWQEKKILRLFRKVFVGSELAKFRNLYGTITEMDSDFNGEDIKFYTKTIHTYSGLSKDWIPKGLKKLEELNIIEIVKDRIGGRFKGKRVVFTPEKVKEMHENTVTGKPSNGKSFNGNNDTSEDSSLLEDIKKKKNTQSVSNYNDFYKKIMSITNLNIMQIQQVLLPIKLKDINIDKVILEIDNSDFLLKQKGMSGFRKYFSTIHQIKKIETGYYQNDTKKAVNDKELFGGI